MGVLGLRGGGDAAVGQQAMHGQLGAAGSSAGGGGDDGEDGRRTPPRTRFEPMECTKDAAVVCAWPVGHLVEEALRLYREGRHCTPNLYTKKGNLRAMSTANGAIARCEKFVERELDPDRVRARSQCTARAQDLLTIAAEQYGTPLVVQTLLGQLMGSGPPGEDSGDEQASHGASEPLPHILIGCTLAGGAHT